MNTQEILVMLFFLAALVYVGRMVYGNLKVREGCGGNCKCGIDFSDIKVRKD
jgi:hypothetical protein